MPSDGPRGTGVVLLQMGGPERPEQLAPFLRALFSDPDMIQLPGWLSPFQRPLGHAFGTLRARAMQEPYEAIGYSSLNRVTDRLAYRLAADLGDLVVGVEVAMRYTPPRAHAAVSRLLEAGAEHILALPLYPFYSHATTGSSLRDLRQAVGRAAPELPVDVIERWGGHPDFLDLAAAWIERSWSKLPDGHRDEAAVLLSAHGLPQAYVDDGDPYPHEVEAAAAGLAARLPNGIRVELAYQSDIGPVAWTGPSTPEMLSELAADGVRHLVVVPFGFVSEHIETLYELDDLYRDEAHDLGIETYLRVPAFDADPAFAHLLEDLLTPRLEAA